MLDKKALNEKMEEGKYQVVFSELRDYINQNPTDKDAVKLYQKFLNDFKKREQKATIVNVDSKTGFHQYNEALTIIDNYLMYIEDDTKILQLKEKIIQEKIKYEIDSGYATAKEQYDLQNYSEALKILTPLLRQYKTDRKLLTFKEQVEKDKWDAQYAKWESEARELLQSEQFENALKKVEMVLKRDSSNKSCLKLRQQILEEEKKTVKKKLWDDITTQMKVENYQDALSSIKELLDKYPDSKAQKLQAEIIEKQIKFEKKKAMDLATAELKAYKFSYALQALDSLPETLQTDREIMSLREKITAEEQAFIQNNLIGTAKQFLKDKKYEAALEKIDEAIRLSDGMSKEAVTMKSEIQKKIKKEKIDKLFEILSVYQKNKNPEEALDIIHQILELEPDHSKANKLKQTLEKELGIVQEAAPVPGPLKEEVEEPTPGKVQVVREYDYIGGEIRFKVAIRNLTQTAITNITVLLNVTEQYTIESLTKQIPYLAPNESRGVDFMLTPMACGQSKVFGTVSYSDAFGEPHSVTVKPKDISIKCPLVVPEDSTREEIDEWLKSQLKSSCAVDIGNIPRHQAFNIANEQIAALDLHNVFRDDETLVAEYLGVAKVTQNKVLIRSTAMPDNVEINVFTDDMKSATGILAYVRNLIQISMNVQSDLQIKEESIGLQILDAFEIIGRLTKLCDICQIRGTVADGNLIFNELTGKIANSVLKDQLLSKVTTWKDQFAKQQGETCSEDVTNKLEYNALNWIKTVHQVVQSKYGVYRDTFASRSSAASKTIESRIKSIGDEVNALENAYMRRILRYLMIIHKENGLVLYKQGFGDVEFDSDLVGGFLTAIQSFGMEISQKETPVTKLAYKDFELELKDGDYIRIAVVLAGTGTELIRGKIRAFTGDFEQKFNKQLEKWDGNIDAFQKLQPEVNKAFGIIDNN